MTRPVDIDSIPERMKASKCWSVWQTEETESGSKQKVCYCRHKRHVDTSKPETWLSFAEAVVLLVRYPEFEGLCFFKSADLGIIPGWKNTMIEAVTQVYYRVGNLKTFLKYKCPFRGGTSNRNSLQHGRRLLFLATFPSFKHREGRKQKRIYKELI